MRARINGEREIRPAVVGAHPLAIQPDANGREIVRPFIGVQFHLLERMHESLAWFRLGLDVLVFIGLNVELNLIGAVAVRQDQRPIDLPYRRNGGKSEESSSSRVRIWSPPKRWMRYYRVKFRLQ